MRQLRAKVAGAHYHVTSRCAFHTFAFEAESKDMFVKIMRRAEAFSGVKVANYCIMDNHFHILVKVPRRKEVGDAELDRRIKILYGAAKASAIFKRWKDLEGQGNAALVKRERDACRTRMYDISHFMKTLKQRFSLWYTTHHGNLEGSIWQGRFHSTLVEGSTRALSAVSAYIDLNPVRAEIVRNAGDYPWCGYAAARRGDAHAKEGIVGTYEGWAGGGTRWKAEAWNSYSEMLAQMMNACDAASGSETRNSPKDDREAVAPTVEARLVTREGRLSRGLAFGSPAYVGDAIARFRNQATTRTRPLLYCSSGSGTLCYAGRRGRDKDAAD